MEFGQTYDENRWIVTCGCGWMSASTGPKASERIWKRAKAHAAVCDADDPSWNELAQRSGIAAPWLAPPDGLPDELATAQLYWPAADGLESERRGPWPCCGFIGGCGGPCSHFPCWDLTT